MFPDSRSDALQSAAKWLEKNFGALTVEDLDGVSDWTMNGMSLVAGDKNLSADAKRILQLFFQSKGMDLENKRRLASSSSSTTTMSTTSSSASPSSTTTTTTTTTTEATTTTTGPATTTTAGPATTTTATSTVTTTTTSSNHSNYTDTTTNRATTTPGTELSGAITTRMLATSIAGLILVKILSGL